MDKMGYRSHWNEQADIPKQTIKVASHVWDFANGESISDNFRYKNVICKKVQYSSDLHDDVLDSGLVVPPIGDVSGHMLIKANNITKLTDSDELVPVMPNYVRDLAGRTISIAECYPINKDSNSTGNFPLPAFVVDDTIDEAGLIENVFFPRFRSLEMSSKNHEDESSDHYAYRNANLYPYKLRLDTFYQDGWKLPQTEMLFHKKDVDKDELGQIEADFLDAWRTYSNQSDYESFYESLGGDVYFEELFNKGFTLIPTIEAYNADAIVSDVYELVDFQAGKYVENFHELVRYEDSDKPSGSIVRVLEPGFVTKLGKVKAKVVISNGSSYRSNNASNPDPLCPDLRLPHTRACSDWNALHIPTHPKHFEQPAIWGWDTKTGMFVQQKGPIWDPLHYYYESVDDVIEACQGEVLDGNYWLYEVPAQMKGMFYPVRPFAGYDIMKYSELQERKEYSIRPETMITRYDSDSFSANTGYHPMPVEYEYELDCWWMPFLNPKKRVTPEIPLNIRDRLCDVIGCNVSAKKYLKVQKEELDANIGWILDNDLLESSLGSSIKDYPYLRRYFDDITSFNIIRVHCRPFISNFYDINEDVTVSKAEYLSEIKVGAKVESCIDGYGLALYDLKSESFTRLKDRHQIYYGFYKEYIMSVWNSSSAGDMQHLLKGNSIDKLEESQFSSVAIMQPPTF